MDDPWQQYSSSGTILEMAIRVWCRGGKESPVFCSTPFSKALCDGAIPSACAGMTIGWCRAHYTVLLRVFSQEVLLEKATCSACSLLQGLCSRSCCPHMPAENPHFPLAVFFHRLLSGSSPAAFSSSWLPLFCLPRIPADNLRCSSVRLVYGFFKYVVGDWRWF